MLPPFYMIYIHKYFPTLELKDSGKCNKEIITTISVLKVYICIKLSFIMKTMEGSFGEVKLPPPPPPHPHDLWHRRAQTPFI